MKKQHILLLGCLMFTGILTTSAQSSVNISYFETYTKQAHPRASTGFSLNRDSIINRITGIPDSAGVIATFVITVNDVSAIDSLLFTLTNSQGQTIYNGGGQMTSLQSNPSFKITGNNLYYTVGPYAYLKHFTATARVRGTDGQSTPVRTFSKN